MFNALLDVVTDDGKPDFVVGSFTNFIKWFSENKDAIIFVLGILTGIIISSICKVMIKQIKKKHLNTNRK